MTEKETKGRDPLMLFDPSVHHGYKELDEVSETVRSRYGTGGNNTPFVVNKRRVDADQKLMAFQAFGVDTESLSASSLKQRDYKDATDLVCRTADPAVFESSSFGSYKEGIGSSQAAGGDNGGGSENLVAHTAQHNAMQDSCQYVRRLTPLECERLQGFPSGWTDIPGASDAKRYRALGNSIALPWWEFLAKRFVEIGGVKSIGSLFDGIGGFPLCFKRAGAVTKWTSEIEPFCEAVVKYHLDNGDL